MNRSYYIDGFEKRLKLAIAESGRDVIDISRRSGVGRNLLWEYTVNHRNPSAYNLKRLAETLKVSTDWLLGISDRKELV